MHAGKDAAQARWKEGNRCDGDDRGRERALSLADVPGRRWLAPRIQRRTLPVIFDSLTSASSTTQTHDGRLDGIARWAFAIYKVHVDLATIHGCSMPGGRWTFRGSGGLLGAEVGLHARNVSLACLKILHQILACLRLFPAGLSLSPKT